MGALHQLMCLGCVLLLSTGGLTQLEKPEIYSMHIYSDIKFRFATTRVTSRVQNPHDASREAIFDVTLPNEAFITNLTLEMDGKIVIGEIKEKEAAKQQYAKAQARGESAAYIGTQQRETNRFNLAVTVAAMSKVSFNLTYQELLKRKHGHYEQVIYIDPGQVVPEMEITVAILESREITKLEVPPLRNDIDTNLLEVDSVTVIERPTPKTAFVKYFPDEDQQKAQSENGIAGQFVVQYDVERDMDAGDLLVVNGYFVHFFAPEGFQSIPKDVLFILDTSGSMSGTKIAQLKVAMLSILDQLSEGDRMCIMTFSSTIQMWRREMLGIDDEDVMEGAKQHVRSLVARGGTNINMALTDGLRFLRTRSHSDGAIRSPVIVFLTDGEATNGETRTDAILRNARANNEDEVPIFSLAFGQYADYDLVKKVALQNHGFGRRIYQASDASMQIAGFYNEISVTLLNNITFKYLDAPVANVTEHTFTNYFNGSEIIVCGELYDKEMTEETIERKPRELTLEVRSNSINGPNVLVLSNEIGPSLFESMENMTNIGDYERITEKVWAYLTIKQLLDKELTSSDKEEKRAINKKILAMSLQYGFVTPLTSMVVTKSDSEDDDDDDDEPIYYVDTDVSADVRSDPIPVFMSGRGYIDSAPPSRSIPRRLNSPGSLSSMKIPASYNSRPRSRPSADLHVGTKMTGPIGSRGIRNRMLKKQRMPTRSKGKKIPRRRKNKLRGKKGNRRPKRIRGVNYPLKVKMPNIDTPLCLGLYEDQLHNVNPRTYTLYDGLDSNVREREFIIELDLVEVKQKRRLTTGGIMAITIQNSTNGEIRITNNGSPVITNGAGLPHATLHNVSEFLNGGVLRIQFTMFDMYVSTVQVRGRNLMNIYIDNAAYGVIPDDSIVGSILELPITVVKVEDTKNKKKRKAKRGSLGKMAKMRLENGNKFLASLWDVPTSDALATHSSTCWNPGKHTDKLFDLEDFLA